MKKKRIFVVSTFIFSFLIIFGNAEKYIIYSNIYSLFYIGISAFFYKNFQLDAFLKAYFGFIILSVFSLIWSISLENSVTTVSTLFTIFLILVLLKNNFKDGDVKRAFIFGLFFGLFVNYLDLAKIISIPIETYENYRYMGTLGKSNILAIVSIFYLIILLIYYTKKSLSKLDAVLIMCSLFICGQLCLATGSRKGLIGFIFIAVFLCLLLYNERKRFAPKLGIVNTLVGGVILYFGLLSFLNSQSFDMSYQRFLGLGIIGDNNDLDTSTAERERLLRLAINTFYNSPFLGNGINSFSAIAGRYSHSNIGEILSGLGIAGCFFFYRMHYTFVAAAMKSNRMIKIGAFSAICLMLLFELSMVSYYDKFFYFSMYFIFNEINTNLVFKKKRIKMILYENSLRYR